MSHLLPRLIRTGAASAALVGMCLFIGGAPADARAEAWSEFGTAPQKPATGPADGPEIREPMFAFLLAMVAADSIGEWTGADVREFGRVRGLESRFPLKTFLGLARTRPDSLGRERYLGTRIVAEWHIVLDGPQDHPMPYSILGYHPGSLRLAGELQLAELAPRDFDLNFVVEGERTRATVTGVRIFALEVGHVLLDADGWLDALLGAGLDDSWTLGFVVGRENGRLIGLGVSLGREGRPIYGEFDFAGDKVLANGRPLASALSHISRNWLNVDEGNLPEPWQEH